MGFQDRDYYRESPGMRLRSAVAILLLANGAVWLFQVFFIRWLDLREYLGCNPDAVFRRGWIWQIFTANFVHDTYRIGHILGNMLFLFFFGRELETIYGRRNFLIFYLAAGCTAIFAEAAITHFVHDRPALIFGASGAVMGTVVLYTLLFPKKEIYLGFLIPVQVWLLCIIYVLLDLSGALLPERIPGKSSVAHWAHLFGAAVGLAYRYVPFGWGNLAGPIRRLRWRLGLSRGPRLVREPRRGREAEADRELGRDLTVSPPPPPPLPQRDPISERIDGLLEKIHRSGQTSLTPEELDFLKKNSGKYKSDR